MYTKYPNCEPGSERNLMVGTILSNCWAALIAFSIYFLFSYPFEHANSILLNASILAIFVFFFTFAARAVIAYIMKEPINAEQEIFMKNSEDLAKQEPSSEELANIVKSMLNEDE